jgi:hypothetical protein
MGAGFIGNPRKSDIRCTIYWVSGAVIHRLWGTLGISYYCVNRTYMQDAYTCRVPVCAFGSGCTVYWTLQTARASTPLLIHTAS